LILSQKNSNDMGAFPAVSFSLLAIPIAIGNRFHPGRGSPFGIHKKITDLRLAGNFGGGMAK
jgi:hypothetical protein